MKTGSKTTSKRSGRRSSDAGPKRDPRLTTESVEALEHLRKGMVEGRAWPVVLLESLGMWTSPYEVVGGRRRQYLIENEAFDLMLLADRLLREVRGQVPHAEWRRFSQSGRFPLELAEEEFRAILGDAKVRGLLNYWYGVALEGALLSAVRDEVRKERLGKGVKSQDGLTEAAFVRIYGAARTELLEQFREKRNGAALPEGGAAETKAFTYWLFKLRVDVNEKAKVASDTRKALLWLQRRHPEPLLGLLSGLALLEAEAVGGERSADYAD